HWPYKGKTDYAFPHDHGYQFRGYRLDALRRPTFQYRYGDIVVEDFFEDLLDDDGRAYFKRTILFESPDAPPLFYFRAGSGKKITSQSDHDFVIDQLRLRTAGDYRGVVRDGDPAELLIPLTLSAGRSTLTLEYRW
ncbi:MAG: hypothetical protein VCA40_09735, partial [Roseibacillus sp.]